MSTLTSDLDGYADETSEDPIPTGGAEALDQADKFLRKIRRIERDRADLVAHAKAEHRRIDEWLADRTAGMDHEVARLESMLDAFARAWKDRTHHSPPKLVNGTLRLVAPRVRIEVEDAEAFLSWARADHRDLLRVKEDADKDAIKQAAQMGRVDGESEEERRCSAVIADGEVIPGVKFVQPKKDSFSVSVS